jgi:hypothetical protein
MNDYGCDPLGRGKWRMVPSGDIVDKNEMIRRRSIRNIDTKIDTLIGALTARQVELMQGGKLRT